MTFLKDHPLGHKIYQANIERNSQVIINDDAECVIVVYEGEKYYMVLDNAEEPAQGHTGYYPRDRLISFSEYAFLKLGGKVE